MLVSFRLLLAEYLVVPVAAPHKEKKPQPPDRKKDLSPEPVQSGEPACEYHPPNPPATAAPRLNSVSLMMT